jgi:uncharacterized phage-like protein YoqJ
MPCENCSFTGHRRIKPQHLRKMPELISRAVAYAYSEGCRNFYSGGAVGFDTLAAREVIRFRISHPDVRLIMLLPCETQSERWSGLQKSSYEYILSASDEVIYISGEYTDTCIRERNMMLASKADILISYISRNESGSAQTARMAQRQNKRIYNLYPTLEKESVK